MPTPVTDVAYIPAESVTRERQPAIGYAMALGAGTLFAVNGTVSKVILESGLSSLRLTEVRSYGRADRARPDHPRHTRPKPCATNRRELLYLAAFGVFGVALVQLFYFLAIHRLEIGVALLIQYLGPLFVALFAFFVLKEHVRRTDLDRAGARARRADARRRPVARRVARRARRAVLALLRGDIRRVLAAGRAGGRPS